MDELIREDDTCWCEAREEHNGERCEARAFPGNGGLCMACLFACAP